MKEKALFHVLIFFFLFLAVPAQAGFLDSLKDITDKVTNRIGAKQHGTEVALSQEEIGDGLLEALLIGSARAVNQASAVDGFLKNPAIHIPLPEQVQKVSNIARNVGFSQQVDTFEETLNRAAEKATPKALPILGEAIKGLTFEDVKRIWKGGDHEATSYLKERTGHIITNEFRPVVHESIQRTGVTKAYQALTSISAIKPFLSSANQDLDGYVTSKAVDGLFILLAEEEKKIRTDPAARTTQLLQKVFGAIRQQP